MIQTVAVTSFRMSLNLYWTFKFASIPPQILPGYIIVAHFLLQSWWHLKEPFFFGGFCRVLQFPCVEPLRWEWVPSSCVVSSLSSCASPSCQMALLVGFHTASAGLVSVSCLRKHLFPSLWGWLKVSPLYLGAGLSSIAIICTAHLHSHSEHCATAHCCCSFWWPTSRCSSFWVGKLYFQSIVVYCSWQVVKGSVKAST